MVLRVLTFVLCLKADSSKRDKRAEPCRHLADFEECKKSHERVG